MELAPVVVFAYNRPSHLQKTLTWLGQNELADQTVLYVYLDGAKKDAAPDQIEKIKEARQTARRFAINPTFKEVHFIERDHNLGLGESIITGVTEVINHHGKCIVLEDDLQTSPLFLDYMNKCLEHYENRKTVFSVSATSRPHPERFYPSDYNYDVYVSLTHHPTGWGTWVDRWNQVDWNAALLKEVMKQPEMIDAFRRMEYGDYDALVEQMQTGKNVWSIRFAFAHFVNHAVSICPIVSYINHIGWDSEATNATASSQWIFERLADKKELRLLDVLYEDKRIVNAWYSFSITKPRSIVGKLINWFGRHFKGRDEYYLKGKVYH